jgi:lysozyme
LNEELHIGPRGAALIKSFESFQSLAYIDTREKDGSPRYGIGWGHTRSAGPPDVKQGQRITLEEADALFLQDMSGFEMKVRHFVDVPLNQNQFDALCSAAFNMSTVHFLEMIAISGLNNRNYDGVASALLKYNSSQGRILNGLTRRRTEEGILFNEPLSSS